MRDGPPAISGLTQSPGGSTRKDPLFECCIVAHRKAVGATVGDRNQAARLEPNAVREARIGSSSTTRMRRMTASLRLADAIQDARGALLLVDLFVGYNLKGADNGAPTGSFSLANQCTTRISDSNQTICLTPQCIAMIAQPLCNRTGKLCSSESNTRRHS